MGIFRSSDDIKTLSLVKSLKTGWEGGVEGCPSANLKNAPEERSGEKLVVSVSSQGIGKMS